MRIPWHKTDFTLKCPDEFGRHGEFLDTFWYSIGCHEHSFGWNDGGGSWPHYPGQNSTPSSQPVCSIHPVFSGVNPNLREPMLSRAKHRESLSVRELSRKGLIRCRYSPDSSRNGHLRHPWRACYSI